MHKIGVLVSGRGSNLQAIMDRIADGYLPLEIAVVISDKPDAFALERAQKADIKTVAVERKACASKEEFEAKINAENGIKYEDFMRLVGVRGNFKEVFEDIMFSTKVIISRKEDFVDFLSKLIENGFVEMSLNYLESAVIRFPNDEQLLSLIKKVTQ